MVPYQIYQVLMDERAHELQAEARRHNLAAEARSAAARTDRSSRLKGAVGHLTALVHVRRSAHARSTTAGSTAGPMGCVA
jgi:hypothetical protein